jgi:hypothetical protein
MLKPQREQRQRSRSGTRRPWHSGHNGDAAAGVGISFGRSGAGVAIEAGVTDPLLPATERRAQPWQGQPRRDRFSGAGLA